LKTRAKHIIYFVILFAFPKNLLSEDFSYIDSLSIQTPAEVVRSIDELVAYCESHAPSDLARVRFYFVWVATHINYDEEMLLIDQQCPEMVFNKRKAVCSGYTRLLAQLCEQSGIPARYVSGYGRDVDDETSIQNHAWNVIRIDGQWHSFDVTWAANELTDDMGKPLSPAFESWFMPANACFQKTHLPFDPVYQLSTELVSKGHFLAKSSKNACDTEGVATSNFNINYILNEEIGLDSLERTCRSFQRAYQFMPTDSAVAIKLAKAQEGKVRQAFDYLQVFIKNDYPNMSLTPIETLKNWVSKLKKLEKPMAEAVSKHGQLALLPLSEGNKQSLKQNYIFFDVLKNFAKTAIEELNLLIKTKELAFTGK
jgi:hypothetical protein